jgi:taurine--2-oxoglutarate transaminase
MGAYLGGRLEELKAKHPLIGDVRYIGLFAGIEFVQDRQTKEPMDLLRFKRFLLDKGVYVFNFKNILFIVPPLIITQEELEWGLRLVDEGLSALAEGRGQGTATRAPRSTAAAN